MSSPTAFVRYVSNISVILTLISLTACGPSASSEAKAQLKEELRPTLKSMTAVSVAASGDLSLSDFEDKLLDAKTEFNTLPVSKVEETFPEATAQIQKALFCWEGAEFVWKNQNRFRNATITSDKIDKSFDEATTQLEAYMKEGLGMTAYNAMLDRLGRNTAYGTPTIFLSDDLNMEVVRALIVAGDSHYQSAKQSLQ